MDRNFILAIALSFLVLFGWQQFVVGPQQEAMRQQQEAAREAAEAAGDAPAGANPVVAANGLGGPAGDNLPVEAALAAASGRVKIETPSLVGSINLTGGRVDDLSLKKYRETLDPDSPIIRLLSPRQTEHGHYISQGWYTADSANEAEEWTVREGEALTPATPVTLTRQRNGLRFEKKISVDENYMFTVTQTVRNETAEPAVVAPYGVVVQREIPEGAGKFMILHEGPLMIYGDGGQERKYKKAKKRDDAGEGVGGWVGITNKYWLAAAVPPQDAHFEAALSNTNKAQPDNPVFTATYTLDARTVAPGATSEPVVSYFYGGPKDVDMLQSYEDADGLGVKDFDKAVDWGNFFFLTRPIFYTLNFFGDLIGNFGVAILILTLIIKAILFPLASKAYESMSRMKKLQPKVQEIQKRYEDDKMKQQQEMMALWKKEKVNPMAGCLPILIQMPIFYALYKTLFVTIELRHEPFIGYIKDLSAPDPTSIFNLFGLLPFEPTAIPVIGAFLGIGVLPLLMGASMWFQMKLNPPPTDPVQQQVFAMMPFIFTFLFASFAAGLVLYWFWNTLLSIFQQWWIMKRNGVDVDWGERLPFLKPKKPATASPAPEINAPDVKK